jgi:hypothetical protein
MQDEGIKQGDAWLRRHLADYAEWCMRTHDLLIVTFDEGDDKSKNQIFTLLFGGAIRPGRYGERIDHYTVLRTIEAMYDLPTLGKTVGIRPIDDIWK